MYVGLLHLLYETKNIMAQNGDGVEKSNISLVADAEWNHHDGTVWCVACHPNGRYFATCGGDKTIRLYNASSSEPVRVLNSDGSIHSRTIRRICFNETGSLLLACSFDATCSLWRVSWTDSGLEVRYLARLRTHESEVKCVAFGPSRYGADDLIATCGRDRSVLISAFDLSQVPSATEEIVSDVDVSGDEVSNGSVHYATSEGSNGGESIFEVVSVCQGHSQDVKYVEFHPLRCLLLSCGYDDSIKVWRPSSDVDLHSDWNLSQTLTGHTSTVWSLAFPVWDVSIPASRSSSWSMEMISVSADSSVRVWAEETTQGEDAQRGASGQQELGLRESQSLRTICASPHLIAGPIRTAVAMSKRVAPSPSSESKFGVSGKVVAGPFSDLPIYDVKYRGLCRKSEGAVSGTGAASSSQGKTELLALACSDGCLRVLARLHSSTCLHGSTHSQGSGEWSLAWKTQIGLEINSVSWSTCGRFLYLAADNGYVARYRVSETRVSET